MNRAEARRKIKTHISKRGKKCDFVVTEFFVYHWWRLMNVAVFDGKLPQPNSLMIRNFKDVTCGTCFGLKNRKYRFRFRRTYENRKEFLTVLVHEMVHSYDWITYGEMKHGDKFHAFADIIKQRVGLKLSTYID